MIGDPASATGWMLTAAGCLLFVATCAGVAITWSKRKHDRARSVILGALINGERLSGATLSRVCSLGSATLYPALQALERDDMIACEWEPATGQYPRRRVYRLAAAPPRLQTPKDVARGLMNNARRGML